ncbi:MAG TPA: YpzG family protein [Firmicutes bacterium]|nr:YpzG family protein [Bacillales bacterium]HJA41069.1 YpzG family protein [Bacillota bacterium]
MGTANKRSFKDPLKKNHTNGKHSASKINGESQESKQTQIMKASLRQFY